MTFVSNLFFFFLVIHFVNSKVPSVKVYVAVVLFMLFSVFIQVQRTRQNRKVNDGLQNNSRKLFDILLNYIRIVTYDNIDVECEKYYDSIGVVNEFKNKFEIKSLNFNFDSKPILKDIHSMIKKG